MRLCFSSGRIRALVCLLFCASGVCYSSVEEKNYWDLSFQTGVTSGTITQLTPNTAAGALGGSFGYGGIPLALLINRDVSNGLTLFGGVHFVADLTNSQITQTGLEIGFAAHLLGGARRLVDDNPTFQVVKRNSYNLSVVLSGGYFHYEVSDALGINSVIGSTFESLIGLQYRTDISENGAIVVELGNTLLAFPASADHTKTSRMEFGVSYRFFL